MEPGYHQKYTELTLPQLLGLTLGAGLPATVALLGLPPTSASRVSRRGRVAAGAAAGWPAGWSIAIKPSNSIFSSRRALLLVVERRRAPARSRSASRPRVVTLALWKYRGLGELAAAPREYGAARVRSSGPAPPNPQPEPEQLGSSAPGARRAARSTSGPHASWNGCPVAGSDRARSRRSRRAFLLIGSWFIVFLLAKGTYIPASIEDASFFRILDAGVSRISLARGRDRAPCARVRARPERVTPLPAGRKLTIAFGRRRAGVRSSAPRRHCSNAPPARRWPAGVRLGDSLIPCLLQSDSRRRPKGAVVHSWTGASGVRWPARRSSIGCCAQGLRRRQRLLPGGFGNSSDNCQLYVDEVGSASRAVVRRSTWLRKLVVPHRDRCQLAERSVTW